MHKMGTDSGVLRVRISDSMWSALEVATKDDEGIDSKSAHVRKALRVFYQKFKNEQDLKPGKTDDILDALFTTFESVNETRWRVLQVRVPAKLVEMLNDFHTNIREYSTKTITTSEIVRAAIANHLGITYDGE